MNHSGKIARRLSVFALGCLLLIVLLLSTAEAQDNEYTGYVGTYTGKGSKGIYAFRFDASTGESHLVGLAGATDNPSFLATDPGGRFLYAVNELDSFKKQPTGAITVFSITPETGALKFLQQVSSLGGAPAHVSLDRSGRFLLVANYGGGNVAVFPIGRDGKLGNHTAFMQAHGSSVNLERQAGPHAHCIQVTPDNRLAIVADLGIDKLLVYNFNDRNGALAADSTKFRALEPGVGPRHVAMVPSGKFMYVVNELTSSLTLFVYDAARGSLEMKQTASTLPVGFAGTNTAAEIIVDSKGKFLYVSNRGDESIVLFSINPDNGSMTPVQWVPSGGKTPRHIALDPTGGWLFSANQNSGMIKLFRVNPDDGRLTATSQSVKVASPVCVTFVSRH